MDAKQVRALLGDQVRVTDPSQRVDQREGILRSIDGDRFTVAFDQGLESMTFSMRGLEVESRSGQVVRLSSLNGLSLETVPTPRGGVRTL